MVANSANELIALYQNAADNVFYFKRRAIWLVVAFSAFTGFLWKILFEATKDELAEWSSFNDVIAFYFVVVSLAVIVGLFNFRDKIDAHRKRIDRCCGLEDTGDSVKILSGAYLGKEFFYGRSGQKKVAATFKPYKSGKRHLAAHEDAFDVLIGLALLVHVMTISTGLVCAFLQKTGENFNIECGVWIFVVYAIFALCMFCCFAPSNTKKEKK